MFADLQLRRNDVVDPAQATVTSQNNPVESNGFFGFLDNLGDAAIGALPTVLDNLTKKNDDPAPAQIVPDQTRVGGDAKVTQEKPGFLQENALLIGAGALAVIGAIVFLKK